MHSRETGHGQGLGQICWVQPVDFDFFDHFKNLDIPPSHVPGDMEQMLPLANL